MIKNLILFLLMSSLSIQSVAVVIDLHVPHQTDLEHLAIDHENDSHATIQISNDENSNFLIDCNHCYHCHGDNVNSLLPAKLELTPLYVHSDFANISNNFKFSHLFRLLRPPQV